MIKISGFKKSSLLDYPDKVSAIIFTHGCNLRCPYCHNPELVVDKFSRKTEITQKYLFQFLKNRKEKLDGVVITGGEPLIHEDLGKFMKKIKDMGYLIKLDTNGTYPERLKKLIKDNLIDYIAMDVKYSKSDYIKSSARKGVSKRIMESIQVIMDSGIDYEFRTTYVKKFHDINSVEKIGKMIKGAQKYYIQNFRAGKTLDPYLSSVNSFTQKELKNMKKVMSKYVKEVYIR
jgi:pyruvate formate lyase activating enzyme